MEASFRAARASGRKLLVPYITGGLKGWQDALRAAVAAGADGIEIGIPFSDPVMDGPVIQQASQQALEQGATPVSILEEARSLDVDVPLAVMTYYNTVHHAGHERFAQDLAASGIAAAIVPDLPLDESGPWCAPPRTARTRPAPARSHNRSCRASTGSHPVRARRGQESMAARTSAT